VLLRVSELARHSGKPEKGQKTRYQTQTGAYCCDYPDLLLLMCAIERFGERSGIQTAFEKLSEC